jgi:hypothetical protein
MVLAEQQRLVAHSRSLPTRKLYLVSPSEQERVKELEKRVIDIRSRTDTMRSKQIQIQRRLRSKMWLNDSFKEVVMFDMRRVVEAFFSQPETTPDVAIINQCFVSALIGRGYLSMAIILSEKVSQMAIDESFASIKDLIEEGVDSTVVLDILQFLVNGQNGFVVDIHLIDELYLNLSNYKILGYEEVTRFLSSLVSEDTRRNIKIEMLAKKQRTVFRERGHAITEIHSYSASQVHQVEEPADERCLPSSSASGLAQSIADPDTPNATPIPLFRTSASARPQSRKFTLNDTVLETIKRRIPSHWEPYTHDRIHEVLSQLLTIDGEFTEQQQERALSYIESFLNGSSSEILGICLQFVESISPQGDNSIQLLWLRGFIGESIAANSCQMGAVERSVTGLRGIGDTALDNLFAQAEGPQLARIYLMSHFNVLHAHIPSATASSSEGMSETEIRATSNARTLAMELVRRSIKPNSSDGVVFAALKSYAIEEISRFSVSLDDFMPEIDAVCEAVSESYEILLKYFVVDFIQQNVSHA